MERINAFTVVELIRANGYEPHPSLSWSCGDAVRDAFVKATGYAPNKALRPKTNGNGGTHCHAVYPASFYTSAFAIVSAVCDAHNAARQRQMYLFR